MLVAVYQFIWCKVQKTWKLSNTTVRTSDNCLKICACLMSCAPVSLCWPMKGKILIIWGGKVTNWVSDFIVFVRLWSVIVFRFSGFGAVVIQIIVFFWGGGWFTLRRKASFLTFWRNWWAFTFRMAVSVSSWWWSNVGERMCQFNVHGSVHHKNILTYIQRDATLHSLFYLETALHVSGGITTHHQERRQLYLQHLVFVVVPPETCRAVSR